MGAKRILLLVFGVLFLLGAIFALLLGSGVIWASQLHKDSEGFHVSDSVRIKSGSYAVTSQDIEIDKGALEAFNWLGMGVFKIEVKSNLPTGTVFLGVAESQDVERYLSGVEHDEVTNIKVFDNEYKARSRPGDKEPQPPGTQGFWLEEAEGAGEQRIEFDVEKGDYTIMAMNADASRGIDVDVVLGIKASGVVLLIGIIILVVGLGLLTGGILMVVFGARSQRAQVPPPPPLAQP